MPGDAEGRCRGWEQPACSHGRGPGDGEAFRKLTDPHGRELQAHCYRMPGAFQDAEDVIQEMILAVDAGANVTLTVVQTLSQGNSRTVL